MTLVLRDLVDSRKIANEVRERSQESFRAFIRLAWDVIEPGVPLLWNWHIDAIAEHLEAVYRGEINRFICNIAPGHAKSTIFSVMFPCWMWIKNPTTRWLCASHSLDLAIRDNRNCRNLIESQWFQMCFGDIFQLSGDQNVKSFFENNHRGYRMALSVGSKGTGKRGTHLLIDDPNNATATKSEIEATVNWFGNTWMSRINSYETGAMIVVGQRIGEQDLTNHILELGEWECLCLPEEFEPDRKSFTSVISTSNDPYAWKGCDPRKEEGELLWPNKFPKKILDNLKKSIGSMTYAAQFQQRPAPAGGSHFKQLWFRYFTDEGEYYQLETPEGPKRVLKSACWLFMTEDLAISQKTTADYTVFCIWAVTSEKDLLLIARLRERLDNPEQQKQTELFYQQYNPEYIKIESVAYQLALIQQLRKRGMPIRQYKPVKDKVSRATTAAVYYESGKVFHPKHVAWLAEWEDELLAFPFGAHDDQVDNATIACDELAVPRGGGFFVDTDTSPSPQQQQTQQSGYEDDDAYGAFWR